MCSASSFTGAVPIAVLWNRDSARISQHLNGRCLRVFFDGVQHHGQLLHVRARVDNLILLTLEQRQQPYLLRLCQTKNVQRLVQRQFGRSDWSRADAQGFQAVEDEIKLTGWSQKRRVVIVRRRIREGIARQTLGDKGQMRLELADSQVLEAARMWEYSVLVTNATYPLESISQLYRDRCDCENGFDELKNQWGLSGVSGGLKALKNGG